MRNGRGREGERERLREEERVRDTLRYSDRERQCQKERLVQTHDKKVTLTDIVRNSHTEMDRGNGR